MSQTNKQNLLRKRKKEATLNNSLFIFYVYFEGSPAAEEPYGAMLVELPNFICSHVPMEIFLFYETRKKGRNQKKVVCIRQGSRVNQSKNLMRKERNPCTKRNTELEKLS
jgi:hypothetical protein